MDINEYNFFVNTKAKFKGCKTPRRKANFVSYNKKFPKEISSAYYYGEDNKGKYVIRVSDHWSENKNFDSKRKNYECKNISTCYWVIKTNSNKKIRAGKAYFKDFKFFI